MFVQSNMRVWICCLFIQRVGWGHIVSPDKLEALDLLFEFIERVGWSHIMFVLSNMRL